MRTYRPAYRIQVSRLKLYINRMIGKPRENLIYSFMLLEEDEEKLLRLVDISYLYYRSIVFLYRARELTTKTGSD